MPVVRRTHAAERDLEEIVFRIAVEEERPVVAERVLRELIARCEKLAEYSPIAREGTAALQLGPEVRLLSYKRWVIIFRYVAEGILILRFADGSQDYLAWKLSE